MLTELLALWPRAFVLLAEVQTNQPGVKFFTLKDPDPEPGLAWYVLNAFFFVGIALLVMIGLGIAFGSFRYWLLEKFPNNRFNGVPDDDIGQTLRLREPPAGS
jgi:hypothetical protein